MSEIVKLTTENFKSEALENQELPVLVDFYTDECAPCEGLAIILDEIKGDYEGKLKFTNMFVSLEEVMQEVDNKVITEYEVTAFPTVIIFREGKEVKRIIGGRYEGELREELDSVLQ